MFVDSEKEEWLRIRQTLSSRMLRPMQIKYYVKELNTITDDLIEHIRRTRDERGDKGLANSLPNEMYRWSMECKLLLRPYPSRPLAFHIICPPPPRCVA